MEVEGEADVMMDDTVQADAVTDTEATTTTEQEVVQ